MKKSDTPKIHGDMTIANIIDLVPEAADILAGFNLGCAGCTMGGFESLNQGAMVHGLSEDDIQKIIDQLNSFATNPPPLIGIEELNFTEIAFDKILEFIRNSSPNQKMALRIGQKRKSLFDHNPYLLELIPLSDKKKTEKIIKHPSLTILITPKNHQLFKDKLIDYHLGSKEFKIKDYTQSSIK